ncbi:hypothetical protein ACFRAR_07780 [Kitasatospora sp. NPDC056651]
MSKILALQALETETGSPAAAPFSYWSSDVHYIYDAPVPTEKAAR